jgi:hypothetical protein
LWEIIKWDEKNKQLAHDAVVAIDGDCSRFLPTKDLWENNWIKILQSSFKERWGDNLKQMNDVLIKKYGEVAAEFIMHGV